MKHAVSREHELAISLLNTLCDLLTKLYILLIFVGGDVICHDGKPLSVIFHFWLPSAMIGVEQMVTSSRKCRAQFLSECARLYALQGRSTKLICNVRV